MEQALEQVPDVGCRLVPARRICGEIGPEGGGGRRPREKVVALDPADIFGAGLKLAVLGVAETPAAPSDPYVERLFDDYADRFDTALVAAARLYGAAAHSPGWCAGMRASMRISASSRISAAAPASSAWNCVASAGRLEGFDLSAGMLAKAAEKAVYDHLAQADLSLPAEKSGLFANAPEERADLVSAADVLMYLGDLAEVFPSAARLLKADGLFAFSVEDGGMDDTPLLRPSLRYAHPEALHPQKGRWWRTALTILAMEKSVIRQDAGQPVHGLLFLAKREA
jgi:predicted TPR repeat methyltransferase